MQGLIIFYKTKWGKMIKCETSQPNILSPFYIKFNKFIYHMTHTLKIMIFSMLVLRNSHTNDKFIQHKHNMLALPYNLRVYIQIFALVGGMSRR